MNDAAALDAELSPVEKDLIAACQVIDAESHALAQLSGALDQKFSDAVDVIAAVSGRVILSGMGKSGHISAKIAATMASTGTPAQFVHPGEASHGDLGMITADDVVICLSNSGNTPELSDIIAHTRRFSIPLIGLTGKAGSMLVNQADIALLLPPSDEACPMGLAPTTSTTCMLALGDALAVAVMARRGFTTDDFRSLHPGGRLGAGLLKVADIMDKAPNLPLIDNQATMADAILVMTSKGTGCTGVIDAMGELCGVITDGDLRRHIALEPVNAPISRIMSATPKTIAANALAAEAVARMQESEITSLFVLDSDGGAHAKPTGFINIHMCLRAGVI